MMLVAECTPEFRAELARRYRYGVFGDPANGEVWHNVRRTCSVCAIVDWPTVMDHCHATGFLRGWLCAGCNNDECRLDGPVWELWRTTAPLLKERRPYVSSWRGKAKAEYLTADELGTLGFAELLAVHAARAEAATIIATRQRAEAISAWLSAP